MFKGKISPRLQRILADPAAAAELRRAIKDRTVSIHHEGDVLHLSPVGWRPSGDRTGFWRRLWRRVTRAV